MRRTAVRCAAVLCALAGLSALAQGPAPEATPNAPPPDDAPVATPTSERAVRVVNDDQGSRLLVDGKPLMVRGINWDYVPVGENYAYSLWEQPDEDIEKVLARDMGLLRELHVNVIRVYSGMPARWIRHVYERYGIYTVLNHTVGRYGLELDGVWTPSTDYSNPRTREVLKGQLRELVAQMRGTPGLLMWMLGNENNYGLFWASAEIENLPLEKQQDARADALYSLMGELIDDIHAADPAHPVMLANGDLQFIDSIAKHCKHLDVMGANVYRGRSAGDLFDVVKARLGVPFLFTEFGADAWNARTMREDEVSQASVLKEQWREIDEQSWGKGRAGNAIGGFVFQWADGWWKFEQDARLDVHDTNASWSNAAYPDDYAPGENNMNEEWWGIMGRDTTVPGELSPLKPRAAYFVLKQGFRIDPYAEGATRESVAAQWNAIEVRAAAREAVADRAVESPVLSSLLQMVRVSDAIFQADTFTTGGSKLLDPARNRAVFGSTQSAYLGVEVTPTSNVRGRVVMNVLGGVAINPIDEIFFERRGPGTVKLYQASLEWNEKWFSLTGFYREGHYHWGYEGDFFGIYPEANYQGTVDQFNADTPSGIVVAGRRALEGFKVAFGPELYWGANPSVIAKFDRKFGAFEVAAIHQQDIAQRAGAGTSSVLPLPQTAKSTLYVGWQRGGLKLEWGGIVAGYDRVGRAYQLAVPGTGPTYLNSGSSVLDDTIRWYDTLGTKAKLTWTGGRVQLYAQGGYRGLVADSSGDQTLTLTGWRLRETGQGNHWHAIAGATIAVTSAFQVAPNVLYQKPLAGPLPTVPDFYEPRSGTYFPGLVARNQLKDPFWVRSNRETLGGELLLVFDPTPASFFWQWNNPQKENAPFAASLSFVYRHQPTARDAGLAVLATGQVFAFPGSNPAQDVWELWGRFVVNAGPMHMAGTAWAGTGQANGVDPRLVTRGGLEARVDVSRLTFTGTVKLNDWGPFDYYRDFNLTFPLQLTGDVAWTLGTPRWFYPNQTKLGAMAKYRTLDQYSPRGDLAVVTRSNYGTEWEVKTYVRFSL